MASPPNSPLNQEHLNQINAALNAVKIAETQIILARQAGIDVKNLEQQLADSKEKLRLIKNTYFPGM